MAYLIDANGEEIDVGSPAVLDNLNPLTVYAWIHLTTTTLERRVVEHAFDDGTTTATGWEINHNDVNGSPAIRFNRYFSESRGLWEADNLPNDQWVHLALVYDDSSVSNDPTIYFDGVAQSISELDSPSGSALDDSSARLTIGNLNHGTVDGERPINGRICLVGIHEALLTAGEIQTAMRRGWTQRGLVGFWPLFNSGVDLSGNANNGTVTNATVADHAPVAPPWSWSSGGGILVLPQTGGASPQTITPTAVAGTWAVDENAVVDQTVRPAAVSGTWSAQTPTSVPGAITKNPASISGTWATQSVTSLFTVSPDSVNATWSVQSVSRTVGPITRNPDAVAGTWAVQSAQANQTIHPASVSGTWSTQAPTSSVGTLTITPDAVSGTWAVQTVSRTVGAITKTPASVSGTWTVQSASSTAGVVVVPAPVTGTWSVQPVTRSLGAVTKTPAAVSGTWAVQSASSRLTIKPSAVSGTWATQAPTRTLGTVTLVPAEVAATWATQAPSFSFGALTRSVASIGGTWAVATVSSSSGTFTIVYPTSGTVVSTVTSGTVVSTVTSGTIV